MSDLLRQLLMLARMDEQQLHVREERLDLAAMVRGALAAYQERMEARRLSLISDLPETLSLRGNREALGQLLVALLDNAAQYANECGRISVSLHAGHGGHACV